MKRDNWRFEALARAKIIRQEIAGLRPIEAGIDDVEEKLIKEKDKKPEYSRQFYCHSCHRWQPCKNDFTPYDCPLCGHSRW